MPRIARVVAGAYVSLAPIPIALLHFQAGWATGGHTATLPDAVYAFLVSVPLALFALATLVGVRYERPDDVLASAATAAAPLLSVFAVPVVGVRFVGPRALIVALFWLSTAALAIALVHVASLSLSGRRG